MAQLVRSGANDPLIRRDIYLLFQDASDVDAVDFVVRGHFHYRPEHEEVVRTPGFMLAEWQTRGFFEGDCDDAAVMLATVLLVLGYRVRFVAIRLSREEFEHVFVEAYSGGWRVLDPTVTQGTEYRESERMVESI